MSRPWNQTAAIWARRWRRLSSDCRQNIYQAHVRKSPSQLSTKPFPAPDYVKPNAYCLHDGIICIREENVLRQLHDLPAKPAREFAD